MPEVGRSMQQLLDFEGDVAATFALSFSVDYDFFGELRTQELKPGGSQVPSALARWKCTSVGAAKCCASLAQGCCTSSRAGTCRRGTLC